LILDSYRCSFSFSLRMRASVRSLYFRYSASRSSLLGASAAAVVGGPLPSEVGGGRRFSGLFGGRRIFSGLFGGGRRWTSGAGGGSGGPLGRRLRGDRERDLEKMYLVREHSNQTQNQCFGSGSDASQFRNSVPPPTNRETVLSSFLSLIFEFLSTGTFLLTGAPTKFLLLNKKRYPPPLTEWRNTD
jgi:hypothetical protein